VAGKSIKERRMFERIPCFITGEYVNKAKEVVGIICENISAAGARLLMPEVPENYKTGIRLVTNERKYFSLKGTVRWHKKEGDNWRVGMSFDKALTFPLKTFF
jgi:hypothetical protein|tara:strand:+ start:997 stop:1305 length:309 start_codon:yes stop_codon:yes gene_type:complete